MQIKVAVITLALALGLASAGHAQAPPCKSEGDPKAKIYSAGGDMAAQMMIAIGIPTTLDEKVLAKVDNKAACQRSRFTMGSDAYVLTGENSDDIPRKAVTERADAPIAFLAPYADVSALVNKELGKPAPQADAHFVLIVLDAKTAKAFRLYTSLPPDAALAREMEAALRGGLPPVATLDRATKKSNIYIQAPPPKQAQAPPQPPGEAPPGLTPPPGASNGRPFQTSVPDGQIFVDTNEGGARHAASGFVCPAQVAGRRRARLLVFDTAQNGRDVACGYGIQSDSSWYTLYLTKIPGMTGAKVWDAYEDEARKAVPPKGKFEPPLAAGRDPPAPRYASFWKNGAGAIDGLWLTQIGEWHIKLRATFHEQDAAEAKAMAEALYKAIYEQMKAPAV